MKRHHQIMTIVRIAVGLVFLAGCPKPPPSGKGSPAGSASDVPPCEEPANTLCDRTDCGANSPIVNTFPINGLRTNGECNLDGVQLVPSSLTAGTTGKCNGDTLAIRDNELVGMTGRPDQPEIDSSCKGDALAGATFRVRGWAHDSAGKKLEITMRVADVVKGFRGPGATDEVPRTAYRITDSAGSSLCTAKAAVDARNALKIPPMEGLTDPPAGADLVIPVISELYDADGEAQYDHRWRLPVPEWMHLACVDDALAKRSLHGLLTDNVDMSRAALMMLVADYCGNLHETTRGAEVKWVFTDNAGSGSGGNPLEAKWGPERAICVANPRALYQQGSAAQLPVNPQDDLALIAKHCPSCSPQQWTDLVRKCDIHRKPPAPNLPHPPAVPVPDCGSGCGSADCKTFGLWSYAVPKAPAP